MSARLMSTGGAIAALVAGILLAVGQTMDLAAWRAETSGGLTAGLLLLAGHIAAIPAFVGIASHVRRERVLALGAATVGGAGSAILAGIHLAGIVGVAPAALVAIGPVALIGALGVIGFLAALVVLGVAVSRDGGEGRAVGATLAVGAALVLGGLLDLGMFIRTVGTVLVGVALVWQGAELWATRVLPGSARTVRPVPRPRPVLETGEHRVVVPPAGP